MLLMDWKLCTNVIIRVYSVDCKRGEWRLMSLNGHALLIGLRLCRRLSCKVLSLNLTFHIISVHSAWYFKFFKLNVLGCGHW